MMIKLKEVQKMTSLSRSSIYAYIDKGIFPAQVKVGERSVAWNYDEITNWLKGRILARDVANAEKFSGLN